MGRGRGGQQSRRHSSGVCASLWGVSLCHGSGGVGGGGLSLSPEQQGGPSGARRAALACRRSGGWSLYTLADDDEEGREQQHEQKQLIRWKIARARGWCQAWMASGERAEHHQPQQQVEATTIGCATSS